MFQPALNLIREECSGPAALNLVADISRYHRIQVSPGYRQAVNYVLEKLKAWGLPAELLRFQADFDTQYGGECLWPEWEAQSGTLHLIEPENSAIKLADFRETPISLIQRSIGCQGEYELVVLPDKGEELKDYTGLDVAGKMVIAGGNVMLIEKPSEALPAFAYILLERLREEFFAEAKSPFGQSGFPLFRHALTSFSGGSDHFILSDPLVGIATPMIIQWPDKFYHTSADTPDKVSPESLSRAAALAAVYSYWLANAGEKEAQWLEHEMNSRFKQRILKEVQTSLTEALGEESRAKNPGLRLTFLLERHQAALDSLKRLGKYEGAALKKETKAFVKNEFSVRETLHAEAVPGKPDLTPETGRRVPRRLHAFPVSARSYVRKLPQKDRDAHWAFDKDESGHTLQTIALYWADGKRTLAEIIDCVEWETGERKPAMLVEYFQWMEKIGVVTFV
jgi:hypothetical protein